MKKGTAREDFLTAFWELYQKQPIEKISIRALCEIAGYNRTTFYVYFTDIYDLLEQFIQTVVCPVVSECTREMPVIGEGFTERILSELMEMRAEYIRAIIHNGNFHILERMLMAEIKEQLLEQSGDIPMEYAIRYQLSAVFGVLKLWFEQKQAGISKEQLLALIQAISQKGIVTVVRNGI